MNPGDFNIRRTMQDIDINLKRRDTVVYLYAGMRCVASYDLAIPGNLKTGDEAELGLYAFKAWLEGAIGEMLEFEAIEFNGKPEAWTASDLIDRTVGTIMVLMRQVRWTAAVNKDRD